MGLAAIRPARFPDTEFAILWAMEYGKGIAVHGFSKDTRLWGFRASEAAMQVLPAGALAPWVPAPVIVPAVMAPELIM